MTEGGQADLLLLGGRVWTGVPGAEPASAIAVRDGRIVATGSDEEVQAQLQESPSDDPTSGRSTGMLEVVELEGCTVLPGFIDAHTHFLSGGFQLASVDLRDAATPREFADRVARFAQKLEPGSWVQGGDWDHELWGGQLPHRDWIDASTRDHPVMLTRLDGHMALANEAALRAGGVTAETPDPAGGTIVREGNDPVGSPTGILKDEAMGLVLRAIPQRTEQALDGALQAAARHALSLGVTQVHDMGSWGNLETYRRAHASSRLPLRVYSVVPMVTYERMASLVQEEGRGDDWLWWGGLKAFVDGSLGSATAWFHAPYEDDPDNCGLNVTDPQELRAWIHATDLAGLHPIVHAIGDRANDWLLDVFEQVVRAHAPNDNGHRDRRFRIEHAQHLTPTAIRRFALQRVVASVQPYHAADDGRWAEKKIGRKRIRTTYAFRSLLEAGATLAAGSDWTVAPLNPLLGIQAAVTRETIGGANPGGWVPEERISLEDALRAYTVGAAFAGYSDGRSGVLARGAHADLTVLSGDLFRTDPTRIGDLRVIRTVVGGRSYLVEDDGVVQP